MLSWLFKKRGPAPATPPAPARGGKPAAPRPAAATAGATAAPAPAPAIDEGPLLRAALGDDAALLRLAQSAQTLATKLAAVEALADEGALRQAERNFRSHDRKVHRLAKQRLDAAVTRREAQAQAQALLERTRGLLGEVLVPVNHLVEIDRAWAALPADALVGDLQHGFATLRAELDARMRAHDEAQRRLQRWTAEARQQLETAPRELATTAEHGSAQDAARLAEALAGLRKTRPDAPAAAALDATLMRVQQAAAQVQSRLAQLEGAAAAAETAEAAVPEAPPPVETEAEVEAAAAADSPAPVPAPEPAPDLPPELARALAAREAAWHRARQPAARAVVVQSAPAAEAEPSTPRDDARRTAQRQRLEALVQQAEAALAEGQLGVLQQRLQAIEHGLAQAHAAPPDGLRARLQALQAERGRLKAWQQWGGARARDDLMAEAEALARHTLAAAPPGAPETHQAHPTPDAPEPPATTEPPAPEAGVTDPTTEAGDVALQAEPPAPPQRPAATDATKGPRPSPAVKLNLKAHAESIQSLRRRWKALDHQGAVASAEQWQRFDAALQLAHEPVAAQQATLKAARQENLAAREALLNALESGPAAHAAALDMAGDGPAEAQADSTHPTPPDWRACIAELDRFQTAWRKLGPVEHTVPAAARDALLQRLQATLAHVEGPLQQARSTAAAEREELIAQAERLLPPAGGRPAPEATRQVRELQAAWQDHARRLPLPRGLETALWARFKAATDAVFTQREAAFAARDAELAANLAAAQALVDRLAALDITAPPADIQRTLAEVDRAWRQGGELPRGAVETLEARFHAARSAAAALLSAGQQQRWQARCDALAARLSLCEAREDGAEASDALNARWAEPDALPAPWQLALAQRWAQAPAAGPLPAAEVDDLLLRLEAALDLPTSPAWQAARQQLKLRALKDVMEGRAPAQAGPQQNAGWLQALLRQAGLDATQRARLAALVAALRTAQPAVLGLPAEKA